MNFYYDESDNIRKFMLKKETSKFNSYHLTQFTFGGLVSKEYIDNNSLDDLYSRLKLQVSIKEIKSQYILNKKKKRIA